MDNVTRSASAPANLAYFAPLLPWQQQLWQQLTARVSMLPHGLLFAGMAGIGKHAFVWRFTAWLLCQQRQSHPNGACGDCQSCLWLASATHPDLIVLPSSSLIINEEDEQTSPKTTYNNKKPSKTSTKKKSAKAKKDSNTANTKIKVDDIRELQPFVNQGSHGQRICIIDYSDTMTVAAANALLKTLEEPKAGVYLLLISDTPAKLLPTIKSRVQQIPLAQFSPEVAQEFLKAQLTKKQHLIDVAHGQTAKNDQVAKDTSIPADLNKIALQLLAIADGAPLNALAFFDAPWYGLRQLWLTTWRALQTGQRSSVAASDYWQTQLALVDFIQLTQIMLSDLQRIMLGIPPKQQDINFDQVRPLLKKSFEHWVQLQQGIDDMKISLGQNVQEKLAYDELMQRLADI